MQYAPDTFVVRLEPPTNGTPGERSPEPGLGFARSNVANRAGRVISRMNRWKRAGSHRSALSGARNIGDTFAEPQGPKRVERAA